MLIPLDREQLIEGIVVDTEEELSDLLENFISWLSWALNLVIFLSKMRSFIFWNMIQYRKIYNWEGNWMIILGIDPGIAIVGYSIIECNGNNYKAIEYGCITTSSKIEFPERLKIIYDDLIQIIDKYNPEEAAIEELFFNKNVATAINVGHARGVQILAAMHRNLRIYEYTPLQIKQAVVGYGRADKNQVQQMVKMLLNLKEIPKPDDAADALAIAMCHGSSLKFKENFRMK